MARRFDADREVQRALKAERLGDHDAAVAMYRAVLRRNPEHVGAHTQLGGLLGQLGRLEEALEHLEVAAERLPDERSVRNNLGHVYRELGNAEASLQVFERLAAQRTDAPTLYGLGAAHHALGAWQPAETAYQRALSNDPDFAPAWLGTAAVQELSGRPERAIQTLTEILARFGPLPGVRCRLGTLHLFHGTAAVGQAMLRGALQDDPNDAIATQMLAGVEGRTPEQPAEGYVAALFDAFADGYDTHLQDVLETRVPALVAGAAPGEFTGVLDLGCGTGLAIEAFGPRLHDVVGVDVSPRMARIAATRGLYGSVHCAPIADFLAACADTFALVLAADVLVYVGALDALFAAVARVLEPGGRFVFTVEDGPDAGFVLAPTGRYAHSDAYVTAQGEAAGFEVRCAEASLRREGPAWVAGRVYILEHP